MVIQVPISNANMLKKHYMLRKLTGHLTKNVSQFFEQNVDKNTNPEKVLASKKNVRNLQSQGTVSFGQM